jgi:hypothetical protein
MEYTRIELSILVIALSSIFIAGTFFWLAYSLIKGSNNINTLIQRVDKNFVAAANEIKYNANNFINNAQGLIDAAKSKVDQLEPPSILKHEDFEVGFQETLAFMRNNENNPNVHRSYVSESGYNLWAWQQGMRKLYSKRKLNYLKIKQLEDIGFTWKT